MFALPAVFAAVPGTRRCGCCGGVYPRAAGAFVGRDAGRGHLPGPTGLRSIAELIETLRLRGGGIGLFTGCAAGDTGAALVLEVTD